MIMIIHIYLCNWFDYSFVDTDVTIILYLVKAINLEPYFIQTLVHTSLVSINSINNQFWNTYHMLGSG